ncbi:siderophore-interacting protein [Pseudonocardia saturnea]
MTGRSFTASPNALFETRIAAVETLSPGFVRLTLGGPQLVHFAPRGLDLRIKVLVPRGGYPSAFAPSPEPVPESEWRACRRSLPTADRPVLRTYTPSATRPEQQELDLDVFLHSPAGPASAWAAAAGIGERVLVSGPDTPPARHRHPAGPDTGTGLLDGVIRPRPCGART